MTVAEFLQLGEVPSQVPFAVTSEISAEGYDRLRIEYRADDQVIPAFLLRPHSPSGAAVLIQHQHASQWHLGKSEVAGLEGDPLQAFGPPLARAGLTVLAPDSICFEERRPHARGTDPGRGLDDRVAHLTAMSHRLVVGDTLMRRVLRDAMHAFSLMMHLPRVDPARAGTLGHSYGGNTVLFHAAVDARVRFAGSSGAACSYRRKLQRGTGIELAEILPGFAARYDVEDLLRAIAPRPLLLVSGAADRYSEDADELERITRTSWPDGALTHVRDDGAHEMTQPRFDAIVEWIRSQSFTTEDTKDTK
jgi:dienelactone hydrolase